MKKLIASGVCFDDGLFEVVLVKTPKNAIELSNTINEAVLNKLNDKHFVTFKTSKVTFTSVNEVPWTLDGESGRKAYICRDRKLQAGNKVQTQTQ